MSCINIRLFASKVLLWFPVQSIGSGRENISVWNTSYVCIYGWTQIFHELIPPPWCIFQRLIISTNDGSHSLLALNQEMIFLASRNVFCSKLSSLWQWCPSFGIQSISAPVYTSRNRTPNGNKKGNKFYESNSRN